MKFALNKEIKDFFNKNGWINFDDFVPVTKLKNINNKIDECLAQRLQIPTYKLSQIHAEILYNNGHDLWRDDPELKQFISQKSFAEIASELIEQKPLRLGYDQLLPSFESDSYLYLHDKDKKIYEPFIFQNATLEEISSFDNILIGALISLNERNVLIETGDKEGKDIFPIENGQVTFFKPDTLVDWSCISRHSPQRFYLIVYTASHTSYIVKPKDPQGHYLKHLGYIINDKLNDKLHPIIYR